MEFATMEENAANYFASMSHLASRMMQYNHSVREMYRDTWDSLSWEKQEELIDQHTIDPKIVHKYASCRRTSEPLNCFPVLKINSGEKIVVDFEHDDGWTWTDEHSAPFSWKTKSQQDLTLLELEDNAGSSKEEQTKKSRVGKKSRSPDRGMFDAVPTTGDRSKNEVEKMFEKFGIKVPTGSDDEDKTQESSADVITKDPDSMVSPSHLYNEHSKLLDDMTDSPEGRDFEFRSEAAFEKSKDVRKSASKQGTSAAKKEPKNKSQGGGKKEKGKTGQGKGVKEKTTKKKKASMDSLDNGTAVIRPSADEILPEYYTASHEESEAVPAEMSFPRPSALEAAMAPTPLENQEDVASAFVLSPSDLTSAARSNDVFEYGEVEDSAPVVTSQPRKFELDLDGPFASSELVESKRDSVVKTGFDFLDNW